MRRGAVAVALVALLGCARRTDFIGRVFGDGGGSGSRDGGGDDGGSADVRSDSDGAVAATCPLADPTLPAVPPPVWTCGVERCLRDPGVDPALFRTALVDADPLHKPALMYPLAGSVHPVNLSRITVQWRRRIPTQTAFRIRIDAGGGQTPYDLHVSYQRPVGAPGTNIEELDVSQEIGELWRHIARQHAGVTVTLTVAALDSASGRLATSDPIDIRFSPAGIQAGLFYLATEPPEPGIRRHVFGTERAQPVVRPGSPANAFDCGGCHAVSRDGSTLAFAATYAGNLTVAPTRDPEHPTMRPPPPPADVANGIAPAVSPDGTYIVARHGVSDSLIVYNSSGQPISQRTPAETGGRIDFPEFSPDGNEIVATRARGTSQPQKKYSAFDGHLVVLPFSGGTLGPPELILDEPAWVHAHPSWSPDGRWIVFTSAPAGGESHGNPQTRLRLVNRQDHQLLNLDAASGLQAAFFPKFAPTALQGCRLFFIAFHSRRDYGLLRRNSSSPLGGVPQLWLSAIDLDRAGDPSSAPIWLPFQEIDQQNLLPVWTAPLPCGVDGDCGAGAICDARRCVARP